MSNKLIEIDGERKTLTQWARLYHKSHNLILVRMKRGWDVEEAIVTPARKYRDNKHGAMLLKEMSREEV